MYCAGHHWFKIRSGTWVSRNVVRQTLGSTENAWQGQGHLLFIIEVSFKFYSVISPVQVECLSLFNQNQIHPTRV
jgi:hypothetical protein